MRHWIDKFRCAGRGLVLGAQRQSSFAAHAIIAIAVLLAAAALGCERWQWCVLLLCIALVLSLEYANSALERLAKGLCSTHNPDVGAALDIASAAVLIASAFAAVIGLAILGEQLWRRLT